MKVIFNNIQIFKHELKIQHVLLPKLVSLEEMIQLINYLIVC